MSEPFGGPELTPAEVAVLEARAAKEGWIHRDLVSLDQFANVVFFKGLPDETMSSHFQRLADRGNWFGKAMCAWLDVIQARHGQKAQAGDTERAEAVEKTEEQYLHPASEEIPSSTDILTGEGEKKNGSENLSFGCDVRYQHFCVGCFRTAARNVSESWRRPAE